MRVIAALSGGVDSAVAAARAIDAGHEVVGIHLALTPDPAQFREGGRGCCSLEDARDARRVADVLGIAYYVWDLAEQFQADVIDDFVSEYLAGRTPNPCLRCNEHIKFSAVLDRAIDLGFDAVVTGHYAQREVRDDGVVELHRAVDATKDQSYVLAVLEQWQLQRSLFPLGADPKTAIRVEALERGLLVADKPDSHDICFVADGRTQQFLRDRIGPREGDFVDAETGQTLGRHDGTFGFTVGQRRGVTIERPRADGAPRYVVGLDASTQTVLVGPESLLRVDVIDAANARWTIEPAHNGAELAVQVRAHGDTTPATVQFNESGLRLTLQSPERGIAAGQTAAMYAGTQVVGSATITGASRSRA
jgi:tRNA-specific 2-thiouridylase